MKKRAPKATRPLRMRDVRFAELDGMLFPWKDGPVFVSMPGSDALYLPVFSKVEDLRPFLLRAQIFYLRIKQIQNGDEFIESLPRTDGVQEIKVILNPYYTPEGRVRFVELKWN